jgi:plastocyanin
MVTPGGYTEIVVLSITHGLAASGEAIALSSTSPTGINVTYAPASPVQVSGSSTGLNVSITLTASATAAIGNDTITIHGVSGSNSQTTTFTLRVVQYRVVMVQNTFSPAVLNVTAGTTVFWQNLDGPAVGCGGQSTGGGQHNVVFTTLSGVNSSTIQQFGIYQYTFTTPGSYFYYSSLNTDHVMNGTINVLAAAGGGAGGMVMGDHTTIPNFLSFGPGRIATAPQATTNSTGSTPSQSPAAVGKNAFMGSALPTFSLLSFATGLITVLSGGIVIAVVAVVGLYAALSKRRITNTIRAIFMRRLVRSDL